MEKLLTFFLSAFLLIHIGCTEDATESAASPNDEEAAEEFLRDARYFQGSNRSQNLLDSLIAIYPQNEGFLRQKSIPFTKRGDFDKAIPLLEKGRKLNPSENLYYYSWLTLFHYRDYDNALELLNEFDDLTPNVRDYAWSKNVNFLKGLAHRQLGNYQKAINEFNTVIEDEKDAADIYVHVYKGICHWKLKNYSEAHVCFEKTLKTASDNTMSAYYNAMVYKEEGRKLKAVKWMNKARELILRGNKNYHTYYEVFDEVHLMMIDDQLKSWSSKTVE